MSESVLVWRFAAPRLAIASAPVGGGIGMRSWVLNAQVPRDYARTDLDAHVADLAAAEGCTGEGVGMLTAVPMPFARRAADGGVDVCATVGVSRPTWAADATDAISAWTPGTINIVAFVPARLSDAALVNAVATATEAKVQALSEGGVPGTGTASDAVCIVCPASGPVQPFGGPRSELGAPLARAVHEAVLGGIS
jgi:adenosylcobinamide amidohydrolase